MLVGPVFRLAKLMFDTSPRTLDQKDGSLQGSHGAAKRKAFNYIEALMMANVDELDNTGGR